MKSVWWSIGLVVICLSKATAVETKIDEVKVDGKAGFYYWTSNSGSQEMFDQPASNGDAFVTLNLQARLNPKVKSAFSVSSISTLGLENNIVSGTYTGSHPNGADDYSVVSEAWIEILAAKHTRVKLGRQQLDTPLIFGEPWSIIPNTYEATVVENKSIKDLTMTAAFIGRGNGVSDANTTSLGSNDLGPTTVAGRFGTFGYDGNSSRNGGAYALGIQYSPDDLNIALWAYNVSNFANAYWVQMDYKPSDGMLLGVQYTDLMYKEDGNASSSNSMAYGVKIGYTRKNSYKAAISFTQTDDSVGNSGVAFNIGGGSFSNLYTEAWWNFGYVTRDNTQALNVMSEMMLAEHTELGMYLTQTKTRINGTAEDLNEAALSVSQNYDTFKATAAYVFAKAEDQNSGDAFGTLLIRLEANF